MKVKQLSKRIIASVLSMMMVLGCFVIPTAVVNAANDEEAAKTIVNIHYLREDGIYDEWNVWAWADGLDGAAYDFTNTGDAKGAVTTVTITESTPRLGFIVRKGNWLAKDPDPDRYVDLSGIISGTIEVYCKSGEEAFDLDTSKTVKGIKIKSANAASKTEIAYTLTATPEELTEDSPDFGREITKEDFAVVSPSGKEIAIDSFTLEGKSGVIKLAEGQEMNFAKSYTISFRNKVTKITLPEYFSTEEFESQYTYDGDDLGATYTKEKTAFRVWAPTADKIELNIYEKGDGEEVPQVIEMKSDVKGTWVATVEGDLNKKYYTYNAYFEGQTNKDIVDPYAKSVGVNGQRGQILDLSSTDPENWSSDSRHTYKNVTDMEIYEVHVRDFSIDEDSGISAANKGKYLAFTETGTKNSKGTATGVDHLVDLGVTSVHILPSYDFGSVDETKLDTPQFNWGYDPVNYNAPEGSYSTDPYNGEVRVNEYKKMVQGLHDSGIGVIMDVVYNHTYNTQYCFNQLVPGYFYRPDSNGSGCGNDVASERTMVRKFIVDSVKYWASEYHLDGFRFDLMGLIDVDTMNAVRAAVDEVDPTIVIYGEGWTLGTSVTKTGTKLATQTNSALTPGIAYFSDNIRDMIKGSVFDAEEKGYANGESKHYKAIIKAANASLSWSTNPTQIVNYVDCHDNLTLWDKIRTSNPTDSEADQIRQNLLAATIIHTAQGIPFMMSGEEFLRTKTNEDGTYNENSYASPDSVNKLDYSRIDTYSNVYNYYKGLIALRKAHPAFRLTTTDAVSASYKSVLENTEAGVAAFTLDGTKVAGESADSILVIYNALTTASKVTLPEGNWDVYVNDKTAGNTALATYTDTVEVPYLSAMVLVKDPAKNIGLKSVTIEKTSYTYDGSAKKPKVLTVTDVNGKTVAASNYTVSYSNNKNAGTATVTVKGKNPYTGTVKTTFKITGKSITKASISGVKSSYAYTGKAQSPTVTVKDGSVTLKKNTDYTVSYKNNTKVGTATITIKGKGNYSGSTTKTFKITAKSLAKFTTKLSTTSYVYNGKAKTPSVTVKDGTKTLKKGTDYTVTYTNNKKPGKATVKITGKGNYSGTITKTFTIKPKKATLKTATSPKTKKLKVTWTKDTTVTGYQIQYSTSSTFKSGNKTKLITKNSTTSATLSGLTKGKTYYVRIREYKTINGTKSFGAYSAKKKVKIK
ncbi:MAG: type I pullulanase [Clostridia bacterium]|nr:type I pullulanase [Clostridia bacterium]